jgi:aryl-alcohol dehydrogenase-like predicted oxidoreductase
VEGELSRRQLAGTRLRLSRLAFSIEGSAAGADAEGRRVGTIRRARAEGVTTFEVPDGPGAPLAERALGLAFPTPDPELVVVVARSLRSIRPPEAVGAWPPERFEGLLRRSLSESEERLAGAPVSLVREVAGPSEDANDRAWRTALERLQADGRIGGWLRAARSEELGVADGASVEPRAFAGPLSLLDTRLVAPLVERARRGPTSLVALDPFAAGRLDGRGFAPPSIERGVVSAPPSIRQLHDVYDPVLRLGYLTRGGQRPLAAAALGFVLQWEWVTAALLPLPSPERLAAVLSAASAGPLTSDELDRLPRGEPRP